MPGMENYQYTYSYYGTRDTAAAAREEEERQERERRARRRREENHRLNVYLEVKRRKKKAWQVSAPLMLVGVGCAVIVMAAMLFFLIQRADFTRSEKDLAAKKAEYYETKAINANEEALISSKIDIDEILRIATENYQMHYPTQGQVISYTVREKECVINDESIPGKTN